MGSNDTFQDFCQAWTSRFPQSELPAAWEEDVRANLAKHRTKVGTLQEELEKETMYVEYLERLLSDIEIRRQERRASRDSEKEEEKQEGGKEGIDYTVISGSPDNKQQFLEDQCERQRQKSFSLRTSFNLDVSATNRDREEEEDREEEREEKGAEKGKAVSAFVTVINVAAPKDQEEEEIPPNKFGTYSKAKRKEQVAPGGSLNRRPAPRLNGKNVYRRQESKESVGSVSSPLSPSSPVEGGGEAPALTMDSSSPSPPTTTTSSARATRTKPEPPQRAPRAKELLSETKSLSSSEEMDVSSSRGRPDGGEGGEEGSVSSAQMDRSNKVRDLRANWENKPPISVKPEPRERRSRREGREEERRSSREGDREEERKRGVSVAGKGRKDSDSSSRGRMGSPSGKSHDSSDSDHSWGRRETKETGRDSPSSRRRTSGETRLDRLVRRPSGESRGGAPALPQPRRAKDKVAEEPLYDTVATDQEEEQEDEYDNHLLYGRTPGETNTDRDREKVSLSSSTEAEGLASPSPGRRGRETEEEGNYVNIQYFLTHNQGSGERDMSRQISGECSISECEDEGDGGVGDYHRGGDRLGDNMQGTLSSIDSNNSREEKTSEGERVIMYRHILNSIVESEAIYLECLSVSLQYMKAMKVTLSTAQPVIPKEDFDVIFFKVPELHEFHHHFHESLKRQVERWDNARDERLGHHFKMLAQQTKVYSQFLGNYPLALAALHKCTQLYPQFADLTGSIKLRTLKGQSQGQSLSLEDLLHKPVARVQKNCLSLQDLIKYTPRDHPDRATLTESLHMIQNFLNEYNVEHREALYPHQERAQRHLVKNSFTVELAEGSRKLRHLFLFNDVLVCAKYKASGKGEKFTFQLKWYIPLHEVLIVEEPSSEPKEAKPANLVMLKTAASSLRDTIMQAERDEEWRGRGGRGVGKGIEKQRKSLAELEAQLVLASPHLLFQVASKSGKTYSIFLSSEFERAQWVEALKVLQEKLPPNTSQAHNMSMVELQSWVTSCRKFLKTNMGSFLMRSTRDEPLLIGDLHLVIGSLGGLTRPTACYCVVEVDSYGHYFRKAKTRLVGEVVEPCWNEEFIIELEGSENLRLLVYEETCQGTVLRGRATLELSRAWLGSQYADQRVSMADVLLSCRMKFSAFEETIRRVPAAKPAGLFKTAITQTTKKEKRAVPFIITSAVREVERRGIAEVGIYRVNGSAVDMQRLKRAYESNPYEAEQLLKECDIHAVAGILKQYLRDLPDCIFTSETYHKLFETYSIPNEDQRSATYLRLFSQLPQNPSQACIVFLIEHLVRVAALEAQNKMSLHNLATVFGPTMLHAGPGRSNNTEMLASSTSDVMAQSGILHYFLARRARGEPIQLLERVKK